MYKAGASKEEAFKQEVHFLERLNFPYLINMIESDISAEIKLEGREPEKRPLLVLEFAEGEMFDFISKEGGFSKEICRTLFQQLLATIKYLDDNGITHRDLKPENILFNKDFNLKISDFGLSTLS